MKYDKAFFDRGLDRRGTSSLKWDETAVNAPGDIPLWVADMDFPCADEIVQDMRRRLEHPCYGYTISSDADFEAFAGYWKKRHGVDIPKENALMLPCVVTGLKAAVQAFTAPGDEVVIMDPVYGPFEASVTMNGRKAALCSLKADGRGRYSMDLDRLEDHLKRGAKLVMFCNPHNPVSRLWSYEEMEKLITLTARYHAMLLSDEIHADFAYAPGEFISAMRFPAFEECGIALMAASKTFNVAGLLHAQGVCGNQEIKKALDTVLTRNGAACGNIFGMIASASAYRSGTPWLDGLLPYLKANADHLTQRLQAALPDAVVTPVEATYLAWLDLRAYAPTCDGLKEKFTKAGVSLTMGTFFGKAYEGFARLNFGCPRAQLDEGLDRIIKACGEE